MIFYTEVIERQIEMVEGRPSGKERKIITRYYTEFDPDPDTVLDRLFGANDNDNLPPIFYEIEDFSNPVYKRLPLAAGIRPISISIDSGNWKDRLDWTAQWEEIEDVQPPLEILGLTLYSWSCTVNEGVDVAEYPMGHCVLKTSDNFAGDFTPVRIKKPLTIYTGKYIGELDYDFVRRKIAQNQSIVGLKTNYNPVTDITDIVITMEASETQDGN